MGGGRAMRSVNFKVDNELHKEYKDACDNTGIKMYYHMVKVMKEIADEYRREKESKNNELDWG